MALKILAVTSERLQETKEVMGKNAPAHSLEKIPGPGV